MNGVESLARIRVVLSRTSHPGNIGACARAMKTMGLSQLWLVAPHTFPHADALARATGASDLLDRAKVVDSLDEALGDCVMAAALTARRRDLAAPVSLPREAAAELIGATAGGEVALVFGNESHGLSNDELLRCQLPVTIPTNPHYSSLNLGSAVQVMSYELRLAALSPEAPPPGLLTPASLDEIEHMMAHFERAMVNSGFLDPHAPRRLMPRLRRLFARTRLEREEIAVLRGMLAALEPKVD